MAASVGSGVNSLTSVPPPPRTGQSGETEPAAHDLRHSWGRDSLYDIAEQAMSYA